MSIHEDAWNNKLKPDALEGYLANGSEVINSTAPINVRDGYTITVTPLAAACCRGHLDVVKLLLGKKASANAPSQYGRTPLYFLTTRTPRPERSAIVQALITAGANVDWCYNRDGNGPNEDDITPLANAIVQIKDKEVVSLLVNNGASPKKVEELAKEHGMTPYLSPTKERKSSRGEIVDLVMSMVGLTIAFANKASLASGFTKGLKEGMVKKLYNFSGNLKGIKPDAELEEIFKPTTVADFKTNLKKYTEGKLFEKFFARDDPFLQRLAEKASALATDPSNIYKKPQDIKRLTHLALYETFVYCDDSGSMSICDDASGDNRFAKLKELVTRIARVATKIVPDDDLGIGIHFFNSPSPSPSKLDEEGIKRAMESVMPHNGTMIGTNLRSKILVPYVYNFITPATPTPLKRPLLICIITDGYPSEPRDTLMKVITECQQSLVDNHYEETTVMFLLSQIGTDDHATTFLGDLRENERLQEVLHCTADQLDDKFREFRENKDGLDLWLLELLTRPIMED